MESDGAKIKISTALSFMLGHVDFIKPVWVQPFGGEESPEVREWRKKFFRLAVDDICPLKEECGKLIDYVTRGETFSGKQVCLSCPRFRNPADIEEEKEFQARSKKVRFGGFEASFYSLRRFEVPESMETLLYYPEELKLEDCQGGLKPTQPEEAFYLLFFDGEKKASALGKRVNTRISALRAATGIFNRTKKNLSLIERTVKGDTLLVSFFVPAFFLRNKTGEYLPEPSSRVSAGQDQEDCVNKLFKTIPDGPIVVKESEKGSGKGRRPASWSCEIIIRGYKLELFFYQLPMPDICSILSNLGKDCEVVQLTECLANGKRNPFNWKEKIKCYVTKSRTNRSTVDYLLGKINLLLESFGLRGSIKISRKKSVEALDDLQGKKEFSSAPLVKKSGFKPLGKSKASDVDIKTDDDMIDWEIFSKDESIVTFKVEDINKAAFLTDALVRFLSLEVENIFLKRRFSSGEMLNINWQEKLLELTDLEKENLQRDSKRLEAILATFPIVKEKIDSLNKEKAKLKELKVARKDVSKMAESSNPSFDIGLLQTALSFSKDSQLDEVFELMGIVSVLQTATKRFLDIFERSLSEDQSKVASELRALLSQKLIQLAKKVQA